MTTKQNSTAPAAGFEFEAMQGAITPTTALETVLKYPGRVIYQLHQGDARGLMVALSAVGLLCLALYGLVAGALSGGEQLFYAPVKICLGAIAAVLICLPSLYIFTCLSGADATLRGVCGALVAAVALMSLLLVGFAPVAWIFSQSTDSIAFMGMLHLLFFGVAVSLGMRMLKGMQHFLGVGGSVHLRVWVAIFLLVSLQMMTTLRPILGTAERFLPGEKKFFLAHWAESIGASSR